MGVHLSAAAFASADGVAERNVTPASGVLSKSAAAHSFTDGKEDSGMLASTPNTSIRPMAPPSGTSMSDMVQRMRYVEQLEQLYIKYGGDEQVSLYM